MVEVGTSDNYSSFLVLSTLFELMLSLMWHYCHTNFIFVVHLYFYFSK